MDGAQEGFGMTMPDSLSVPVVLSSEAGLPSAFVLLLSLDASKETSMPWHTIIHSCQRHLVPFI